MVTIPYLQILFALYNLLSIYNCAACNVPGYVMVKGQATQKKPWQQGKTTPTMEIKGAKRLRELR